jgi:predicted flap endonuclease-1-like 5' DNA nuclease
MIMLAVQIFLLLLAAYIAGCMLGCVLRRALYTPKQLAPVAALPVERVAAAVPYRAPAPDAARFENALTGRFPVARPADRSDEPFIEVRPAPQLQPQTDEVAASPLVLEPLVIETVEEIEAPPPVAPEPRATEVEPVVAPPMEAPESFLSEVAEDLPPPPPPPPAFTSGSFGSYAALAAAAASAHAAQEAEQAADAAVPDTEAASDDAEWEDHAELAEEDVESPEDMPPAPALPVEPIALPVSDGDDLKRIRAIDPDLELRLNEAGVRRYADIANWTASDVARISQTLGLVDRVEQENWIEQAQILAKGPERVVSGGPSGAESAMVMGVAAAAANAAANVTARQSASPDRFTRIIGIDHETEQALYNMGYSHYAEIAQWTSEDITVVEELLGRPGRVALDNWVEQARVLARYAGEPAAPRPVRLADAIRESKSKSNQQETVRSDVAGLRSVRSQALRGELPAAGDRVDDLKRIRGIGVLIEKRLNALGITSYEQVANWTKADIDSVSSQLDFRGRIERENWIEQARILASGGQTEFSRRVDRGEVETSKDN